MVGTRTQPDGKQYWKDLWRYRELFAILAWRDITVRYKQTFIGVAWALIRPFLTMVVFTVIYSFGEGFAYGGWSSCPPRGMRPMQCWCLPGCCPGSFSAPR
jgi:lipopolysaccharide transport system permease protein